MTRQLIETLAQYRQDLEAEVLRIDALTTLAEWQDEAMKAGDAARLEALTVTREQVFRELEELANRNRPRRETLAGRLHVVREFDGFDVVCALHRKATAQLERLLAHDRATREQLEHEAATRRAVSQELETGEATLAAYRKVLSPAASRSGIVDRRG